MSMVRYQPFGLLNQLYREMDNAFGLPGEHAAGDEAVTSDWLPSVDIREEENAFVIHADVPGVDPKDIDIHMENGVLTVKGERETVDEETRKQYRRVERVRGQFYRRFTLPDTADADQITARVDKGVLEVRIPKHARVLPRKIQIEG
ncbi:Hsp20/alpha crystallin family protein [Acidihalobacter prosperus]|uniref:Heat-shock protein Hsp20 n=1 Tax=Acidihalobacter prosperus TaxID=160660 RepID=A0A1A6C1D0_9GAMM|nr:Hsp20/alpha crystallin family protein [Acidihalobacter prosperus]OBS08363.1 heat-shock protein Hsp20 [Acidihalobacter prosperus]